MPNLDVAITKLDPDVQIPEYAYPGDAGLDLRVNDDVVLMEDEHQLVGTGLAVAIPEGYVGLIVIRSGVAAKQGVTILNSPGIIDSHYRGELKLNLSNQTFNGAVAFKRGERVAQLVIVPIPTVNLVPVDALDETDRGSNGFGSTGTE